MRPFHNPTTSHLLLALLAALSFPVAAQNRPGNLQPLPEIPPPPPGMISEELEPQITITRRGQDKVEEHRINGKLYMLKVTPPHGVAYYLIDDKGDGNWSQRDNPGSGALRVPMWVIGTF